MAELDLATTSLEVFETLRQQPTGLPALYNRMLSRIRPAYRQVSASILQIVILANGSLLISQMAALFPRIASSKQELMGAPAGHASWEDMVRDYISLCGDFLHVYDDRIQMIDQSAKQFFLSDDCSLAEFKIKAKDGHLAIASRCLEYLERLTIAEMSDEQNIKDKSRLNAKHPLCT